MKKVVQATFVTEYWFHGIEVFQWPIDISLFRNDLKLNCLVYGEGCAIILNTLLVCVALISYHEFRQKYYVLQSTSIADQIKNDPEGNVPVSQHTSTLLMVTIIS